MMQDYYGIYTILSSNHEFVIMMLDYYRIDTIPLHDDSVLKSSCPNRKKTGTRLDRTAKDRTAGRGCERLRTGCGCGSYLSLPLTQPVRTGSNRLFRVYNIYLLTFLYT